MVVLSVTEDRICFGAEICFVAIIAQIWQSALGICNEVEFLILAIGGVDLTVWGFLCGSVSECCIIWLLGVSSVERKFLFKL